MPSITVIGTTPLPGLGTDLKDVPANVQIFGRRDLSRQRAPELTQSLELNANSVNVGSPQGNPFQQDLSFRGFAASPLLGTPQGISVFQDGVRVNEAFGDVVNWDLIPQSAISSIQVIPGSNPVFGLNTLGAALAVYTKSGAQYPGAAVDVSGGSFGRRAVQGEYGGSSETLDWFVTGNVFDEDGWAEHNPSRVKQFFGKVGFQNDVSDLDVTLTLADNALQGAQTLPLSFFDNRRQAYTYPDENDNRLVFLSAKGSHFLTKTLLLGGNAYYRNYRTTNLSSNVNERFGELDPDTGLIASNPATNDRAIIGERSYGLGAQLTWQDALLGHANQLAMGLSADLGNTDFRQESQTADFTADRGTVATGPFATQTDVASKDRYLGAYFVDTLSLGHDFTLTLAGRYNHARVSIADRLGEDSSFGGTHAFSRFNPAVGLNFNPSPTLTAYASYNEGMRAPTAIELTCADASAPCKLPNVFLADPPLKKVVSKTMEIGARGRIGDQTHWAGAIYRTDLEDDIQFIAGSGGATNAGFFQNVGKTRRQGVELSGTTRWNVFGLTLRYSHIEATYRSAFTAASQNNSTADENGAIEVRPGDRIPDIPTDSAKVRLDYDPDERLQMSTSIVYASSQYARGDENNSDRHGRLPSYTVVNLDARYRATSWLEVVAQIANLFDRHYATFGILGSNVFTGPNRSFGPAAGIEPVVEQFRAIGAPRGVWIGVRVTFDRPGKDRD